MKQEAWLRLNNYSMFFLVAMSLPCFPETIVVVTVVFNIFMNDTGGGKHGDGRRKRSELVKVVKDSLVLCCVCVWKWDSLFKESSKTEFPDTPSSFRRTIRHVPP